MAQPMIQARQVHKTFQMGKIEVHALRGVDLTVTPGEMVAIMGPSGCGKTTVSRTILRLQPATAGAVFFEGEELFTKSRSEMKALRRNMQIIFQDPYSSLDPRMPVGEIIAEGLQIHGESDRKRRNEIVQAMLAKVGLNPYHANRYPHEFSGGQRQRIGIARALAVNPAFIVCDEPISALDVSIQAQIIALLKSLAREKGTAMMLVTHDMGVIAEAADRVAVMYAGRIAEIGPVRNVVKQASHPYTVGLMGSIPPLDRRVERLAQIDGAMPRLSAIPKGCAYNPRCPKAFARCSQDRPDLLPAGATEAACWLYAGEGANHG